MVRFRPEGKLLDLSGAQLGTFFRHAPLLERMFFGGGGFAAVADDFCVEAPRMGAFTFRAFSATLALLEVFEKGDAFPCSCALESVEEVLLLLDALSTAGSPAHVWCAKRLAVLGRPRTSAGRVAFGSA